VFAFLLLLRKWIFLVRCKWITIDSGYLLCLFNVWQFTNKRIRRPNARVCFENKLMCWCCCWCYSVDRTKSVMMFGSYMHISMCSHFYCFYDYYYIIKVAFWRLVWQQLTMVILQFYIIKQVTRNLTSSVPFIRGLTHLTGPEAPSLLTENFGLRGSSLTPLPTFR